MLGARASTPTLAARRRGTGERGPGLPAPSSCRRWRWTSCSTNGSARGPGATRPRSSRSAPTASSTRTRSRRSRCTAPGELARHAGRLWAAFPDARVNRTGERLSGGAFACAPCKLLGTHREALGSVGATGRSVTVHAVVYAELREGRLLRARAFFDLHDAGVQLGVFPKPGTPGAAGAADAARLRPTQRATRRRPPARGRRASRGRAPRRSRPARSGSRRRGRRSGRRRGGAPAARASLAG